MTTGAMAWQEMTREQIGRWEEVLAALAGLVPDGAAGVVVDGERHTGLVADRLAERLISTGRPCARLPDAGDPPAVDGRRRTVTLADGPHHRAQPPSRGWDAVIWLRTAPSPQAPSGDAEAGADIVIDLHDESWPVIRHVAARLAGRSAWYITESRAFFATRAETWDTKFGDDMPAYAAAVAEARIAFGGTVLDAGCGTGRALPSLRAAVGPGGNVIGLDITSQMLTTARSMGRADHAALLLADARRLPLADAQVDAVFAAGLVPHLPDVTAGLTELARVTRPGGRLIIFHPSGRAALAARHGRTLSPDEPLAETRLGVLLAGAGWQLTAYDDPPHRFFAAATRT